MAGPLARLALVCLALSAACARADEFRIASKVFSGSEKTPIAENLTLFRAGIVYDYLSNPAQVAVFDNPHHRFILLDPERKVRTEVPTSEVQEFVRHLQQLAAGSKNQFLKLQATQEFEAELDDKSGRLTVRAGDQLVYRMDTLKAPSAEAARQYREYSDWYVRLNAMLNPLGVPPFARMAANRELIERQLVAKRVELSILGDSLASEHEITWKLLPTDNKRIEETDSQLARFEPVGLDEFRKQAPRTANSGGRKGIK